MKQQRLLGLDIDVQKIKIMVSKQEFVCCLFTCKLETKYSNIYARMLGMVKRKFNENITNEVGFIKICKLKSL